MFIKSYQYPQLWIQVMRGKEKKGFFINPSAIFVQMK